jgi:AAA domain
MSVAGAQARGWTDPAPEPTPDPMAVETWPTFRDRAGLITPMLIEHIWPEGTMGFVGAAPKAGKTWLAILQSLAVATGTPFLGEFQVARPGPVLYVALEGTREGLRARIGALARGMGIDPEGDRLDDLHLIYKPRGINLSDGAWAARLVDRARELGAVLVTVDVLRRAATVSEDFKGAADFTALLRNLAELEAERRALAFCHHFTKPGETHKGRKSADRMAGSGALYGALDAGLFISESTDGARKMTIEVEARDIRAPRPFRLELSGEGTGPNGGWSYLDTVRVSADLTEVPTGEQIMVDQLARLLRVEPDITKTDAAARIGTGRQSADFLRAWPAAHNVVATES